VQKIIVVTHNKEAVSKLCMVLTQAKTTEFYTDLERGNSGIIKNGVKMPRNTFGMKLMIMVEADAYTGYYAEVVRELDRKHGYVQHICMLRTCMPLCMYNNYYKYF